MKIHITPAAASTPERPSFVWRVFAGGREIAFGISSSENDAREQARLAVKARNRQKQAAFMECMLSKNDDWRT